MTKLTAAEEAMLRTELAREDLQIYTVVVLAARDLDAGDHASAIARLRVDADKFCGYDTPIIHLLAKY